MIPLIFPPASRAPWAQRRVFVFWLGGGGAPIQPPVTPPQGAYWHASYWPDKVRTP